jgi:hypothetical protein
MTSKSKHAGLGIALGAALGAVFGVLAGNMGAWLAIGLAIGVFIGVSVPRKQKDCPQCAKDHPAHEMRNPRQQASS